MPLLSGDPRPEMVEALRRVKQHFKTGCITNNLPANAIGSSSGRALYVAETMALFDHVIESAKIGLRKPDPRIYRMMVEALGVDPNKCVYLDDLGVNPEARTGDGHDHHQGDRRPAGDRGTGSSHGPDAGRSRADLTATGFYSAAATTCWARHCASSARSAAGLTGLLSTTMPSSRAASRTCGLRSAVIRMAGIPSPNR